MASNRHEIFVEDKLFVFVTVYECSSAKHFPRAAAFLAARNRINRNSYRDRGGFWAGNDYDERCGITAEPLKPEDGIVLVISNQAGIPNRIVSHKKLQEIGYEAAARQLIATWAEAQAAWFKYRYWFI